MLDKDRFIADLLTLANRVPPVPWLHQGRDPEVGLDCIGLPMWAYQQQKELPLELETQARAYLTRPDGHFFHRVLSEWFDQVDGSYQPADLLLIYDRKNPQHIAVVIDPVLVVEAYASVGSNVKRVVKWALDPRRVIAGVFRFPENGLKAAKWVAAGD